MKSIKLMMILILLIFLSACNRQKENIIAEVNGEVLTYNVMKTHFSGDEWKILSRDNKKAFIQDWISLTLLAQEADILKISETTEIKQKIKSAEKNVKSNAVIAQKLASIKISEDDLFNYYKLHKNEYTSSYPEYKVQRIYCTDKTKLNIIRAEINNSSFVEAAKQYSEDNVANNGGYVGWKSKNNTNTKIWTTLESLKKHHFKTVETDEGFYIVRYYQKRQTQIDKSFTEVSEEIKNIVAQKSKKEIFENLMRELKAKAEISISK